MRRMRLDDDRASGRERRDRVAAGDREGEREVGRAEDRDGARRHEHAPDVGPRLGLALRKRSVDSRADPGALLDQLGEEQDLARRSGRARSRAARPASPSRRRRARAASRRGRSSAGRSPAGTRRAAPREAPRTARRLARRPRAAASTSPAVASTNSPSSVSPVAGFLAWNAARAPAAGTAAAPVPSSRLAGGGGGRSARRVQPLLQRGDLRLRPLAGRQRVGEAVAPPRASGARRPRRRGPRRSRRGPRARGSDGDRRPARARGPRRRAPRRIGGASRRRTPAAPAGCSPPGTSFSDCSSIGIALSSCARRLERAEPVRVEGRALLRRS